MNQIITGIRNTKKVVTKFSANWNNSSNARAVTLNLNNASSNRNRNISGQLVNA